MEKETITISSIKLEWSDWTPWVQLKAYARSGGIKIPNKKAGVYEVKYKGSEKND